jgi:hypothetical protein
MITADFSGVGEMALAVSTEVRKLVMRVYPGRRGPSARAGVEVGTIFVS